VEYIWGYWKHHELPNFCPRDFTQLSHQARRALRRMRRRPPLVRSFCHQATLHCHYKMQDSIIVWNSRPGTYLLISLLAGLFHLLTYEILTVLLAVVLALTPPVVGIFVEVASGNRLAALIALLMSALSVNQLYFFYHGFAGQIFGEGCLVIAFTLLWKAESDQKHWSSYAFMMGLTISEMLELYQEDVPLFSSLGAFISYYNWSRRCRGGV
jgi:hypothetical protein